MSGNNLQYRKAGVVAVLVPFGMFILPFIVVATLYSKGVILIHLPKLIGPFFLPIFLSVWVLAPIFGKKEVDGVTYGFILSLIASFIGLSGVIFYMSWDLGRSPIDFGDPKRAALGLLMWFLIISLPAWIGGLFFSGICQKINRK